MRTVAGPVATALQQRRLILRNFFSIQADNAGSPVYGYFWSGLGPLTADTIDGLAGTTSAIDYIGSGTLITCGNIVLTNDLAVRSVTVTLNQIDSQIDTYVRAYNLRRAPIQIHRGLFDPDTQALVTAAIPRFVGTVDTVSILTPKKNEPGAVTLECMSCTRELTRVNTDKRSHESQKLRLNTDTFFKNTPTTGGW